MRRIQFIELHEQPWLWSSVRDEITDALQFGLNLLNAYSPIAPLLRAALDSTRSRAVVDLCSGGGGPWLSLIRHLGGDAEDIRVLLTDKYPNLSSLRNAGVVEKQITYSPGPVDAMQVPCDVKGFRTMFTSFHHFPPEEARAILQNAVDAGEGIAIFEITRRAFSTMVVMLAWVFMLIVCAPWIRPFRWSRLLWTYVIPVIPFVLLFDGTVSCLRTYRLRELREIVDGLNASEYHWQIGELSPSRVPITYLTGLPLRDGKSRQR